MKNLTIRLITCVAVVCSLRAAAQTTPQTPAPIKLFFEKTFIHTDRNIYNEGEDIWLRAYVVNAQDNHLIGTSKNLHIELIAPADTMVYSETLQLTNGLGKGDIPLPARLAPGTYRLRAYTNWMRNFGDNFIFEKSITITGSAAQGKGASIGSNSPKTVAAASQGAQSASGAPIIRFFPEGGSLVNDISAIVGVKAEDASGKGIAVSGPVLSATGDTIARFACDSLGMGLFAIVPVAGQKYHTSLKYKGQAVQAALPDALGSGLSLKVAKRDTLIYITISCNNAASATFAGKPLTLSVKHAGVAYASPQIQLTDNQALVKVPESILPEGITAITLYDDQHKPNCERLFYVSHPNHSAKVAVSTEKQVYRSREKVTVTVKTTGADHKPVQGNFSLAAIDAGVDHSAVDDIMAYMTLGSEVRGKIEHIERYFDTTNVNRARQLDMLLLTQGWRNLIWKRLADTAIKISYLPEQGFTVSGNVKDQNGKKVIAGANITMRNAKATGQKVFVTKTNEAGNYYFDNIPLYGQQRVTLTSRNDKGESNGILQIDSLSKNSLPINKSGLNETTDISANLTAELGKRAVANKKLDSVTNLKEVKIKASRNIVLRDQTAVSSGFPDEVLTVTAADMKFNTLHDYILYASKQAKPIPQPTDYPDQIVFFADGKNYKPRFIVDNKEAFFTDDDDEDVMAHFSNNYLSLPMTAVEKVVIRRMLAGLKPPKIASGAGTNIMGVGVVSNGRIPPPENLFVILLTLKPGAMELNGAGLTGTTLPGYYEARDFYKPLHTSTAINASKPDMRNTIHWEPIIRTDANGQATVTFYNADPKTNIRVVVQGVSGKGDPMSGVKTYSVK
ncbi:hypothetical protein HQ865_08270 [Mucilaginibacter mali]|uniref:Macroglobulin domain-containing protein n=1 Tax=Mucilaginibacter mali TaxID=2740462 RepID=A0A7D4TM53_9SPHI|nr:MG2 domain-containing protein [Mucilaginibacter mali]QKJ29753.1 hypothetical protein HQ865_08270 [Mucilaginibacter mali]